ncbi:MAG TPA: addiction module antidote protein [Bacteriovoracaceae bacterium]|nr:addiction module antidote protein [Bacteriovoracaceae bacterium]
MRHTDSEDFIKDFIKEDVELQFQYIKASFEDNWDVPEAIMSAIRQVAEIRGISQLAKDSDLNRENLYRVLSGNTFPRIDTFFKVINALGMRVTVETKKGSA